MFKLLISSTFIIYLIYKFKTYYYKIIKQAFFNNEYNHIKYLNKNNNNEDKITCMAISDTHNRHNNVNLDDLKKYDIDILFHCGDITKRGSIKEIENFIKWFDNIPNIKYKILILGNHDLILDENIETRILDKWNVPKKDRDSEKIKNIKKILKEKFIYLENETYNLNIKNREIKIFGSPASPYINEKRRMAFQDNSKNLHKNIWSTIPLDTNIILTHTPIKNHCDETIIGIRAGCPLLLEKVKEIKPLYTLNGHIHESNKYSLIDFGNKKKTKIINAAVVDLSYKAKNKPIVFSL